MPSNDGINDSRLDQLSYGSDLLQTTTNLNQVYGLIAADASGQAQQWFSLNLLTTPITYSLIGSTSLFDSSEYDTWINNIAYDEHITDWSSTQISSICSIIETWESFANIRLDGLDESQGQVGDIRMGLSAVSNYGGVTYAPTGSDDAQEGDVWLNVGALQTGSFARGTYDCYTVLHELGHALFDFADITTYQLTLPAMESEARAGSPR